MACRVEVDLKQVQFALFVEEEVVAEKFKGALLKLELLALDYTLRDDSVDLLGVFHSEVVLGCWPHFVQHHH